jgi:hypothetical protein
MNNCKAGEESISAISIQNLVVRIKKINCHPEPVQGCHASTESG